MGAGGGRGGVCKVGEGVSEGGDQVRRERLAQELGVGRLTFNSM